MDLVADENVPRALIDCLRAAGHLVISISEIGAGIPDQLVIEATNQRAFLLPTHDRDFGEMAFGRGFPIVGVILLETERLSLTAQIDRVAACLSEERAVWSGFFSVIEPARVRRRAL